MLELGQQIHVIKVSMALRSEGLYLTTPSGGKPGISEGLRDLQDTRFARAVCAATGGNG